METDPQDQVFSAAEADRPAANLAQEDENLKAIRIQRLLFVIARWKERNRAWWQKFFRRKKQQEDNLAHRIKYNEQVTESTGTAPQRYGKTWIEPQRPGETKADYDKRYHREYMREKRAAKKAAEGKSP